MILVSGKAITGMLVDVVQNRPIERASGFTSETALHSLLFSPNLPVRYFFGLETSALSVQFSSVPEPCVMCAFLAGPSSPKRAGRPLKIRGFAMVCAISGAPINLSPRATPNFGRSRPDWPTAWVSLCLKLVSIT